MDGDLLPLGLPEIASSRDAEVFCAEQAEAIRVLGRRVVGDIIEIGNRLIAVKQRLQHGGWLPWLDREFGWREQTARNYMAVAEAFAKSPTVGDLPIDAGALYLLAGPKVPEAAREAAVEKAEQGERITKAEAETLIREARDQALEEFADARSLLEQQIADLNAKIAGLNAAVEDAASVTNDAVGKATEHLKDQVSKLRQQRKEALESLKKLKDKAQAEAPKTAIDGTKSFRSMCLMQGIDALHKELLIAASDAVEVHFASCALTTEKPAARLGPAARQAREIVAWLNDFIAECEKR